MLDDLFHQHAQTRSTGTALLVFENKSLGKVYFLNGEPTSARYMTKQGNDALLSMHQLAVASTVFHQNIDAVMSNVPIEAQQTAQGAADGQVYTEQAKTRNPAKRDSKSVADLSPSQLQEIGNLLAEYVGPAAYILIKQLPVDTAVKDAIESLTGNIADAADASRFSREVVEQLKT